MGFEARSDSIDFDGSGTPTPARTDEWARAVGANIDGNDINDYVVCGSLDNPED